MAVRRRGTLRGGAVPLAVLALAVAASAAAERGRSSPQFGFGLGAAEACSRTAPCVHVVPHSHLDPGWKQTYDQYHVSRAVSIHDGVLDALESRPGRTFVFAEAAFVARWLEERGGAGGAKARRVTGLVRGGRLELVGGGWVSPDEALGPLEALARNWDVGFEALQRVLPGLERPRVAWQVDTFGHAASTPALLAHLGFDAVVLNRVPAAVKARLARRRALDFTWGSGEGGALHAHLLAAHYAVPPELDFEDAPTGRPPKMARVARAARAFVAEAWRRAGASSSGHVLFLWGDDFRFSRSAVTYFAHIEQVLEAVGREGRLRAAFSTPSQYLAAVRAGGAALPRLSGGFQPYVDYPLVGWENVWSGAYANRQGLKAHAFRAAAAVRAACALDALAGGNACAEALLRAAQRDVSLSLHHDAITGTCTQPVAADYLERLVRAERTAAEVMRGAVTLALRCSDPARGGAGGAGGDLVAVFNPLAWERRKGLVAVALPKGLDGNALIDVVDARGGAVPSALGGDGRHVRFLAPVVPPLGLAAFRIAPRGQGRTAHSGAAPDTVDALEIDDVPVATSGGHADGAPAVLALRALPDGVALDAPGLDGAAGELHASLRFATYVGAHDDALGNGPYVDRTPLANGLHLWGGVLIGYVGGAAVAAVATRVASRRTGSSSAPRPSPSSTSLCRGRRRLRRVTSKGRAAATRMRLLGSFAAGTAGGCGLVALTQSPALSDATVGWMLQHGTSVGADVGGPAGAAVAVAVGSAGSVAGGLGVAFGIVGWLWMLPERHARPLRFAGGEGAIACGTDALETRCTVDITDSLTLRVRRLRSAPDAVDVVVDSTIAADRVLVVRVAGRRANDRGVVVDTGNGVTRLRSDAAVVGMPARSHPLRGFALLPRAGIAVLPAAVTGVAAAGGGAEVMLHRSATSDDGRGIGVLKGALDPGPAHVRLQLLDAGGVKGDYAALRRASSRLLHPLVVASPNATGCGADAFRPLRAPLPGHLHALTVDGGAGRDVRVRLSHIGDEQSVPEQDAAALASAGLATDAVAAPGTFAFATWRPN